MGDGHRVACHFPEEVTPETIEKVAAGR